MEKTKTRPTKIGQTKVSYDSFKTILNHTSGFTSTYDWTLNPYSGCSFGCTYCYAAFFANSQAKQDNWGKWVSVKENALRLLRRQQEDLDDTVTYMSTVTDPYQPIERELRLVRSMLEVMASRPKVRLVVQTRSPDMVRDADLFQAIEANGGRVQVNMTVTTDDEDVRKGFEPFCPGNEKRLQAVEALNQAKVQTCITMTPLLLVKDNQAFADRLLATGTERFIVQPFHFQEQKFIAGTREEARALMAEKLGCDSASFHSAYMQSYKETREVLAHRLPQLGEGQEGFAPPF